MSDNIKITKTVARWLFTQGRRLVSDGIGRDWNTGNFPEIEDGLGPYPGFIDDLDPQSDTYMWANALIQFAKTVAAIAQQALAEDIENEAPIEI